MINAIKNVQNIANSFNQQVLKIIEMNVANPQDLGINSTEVFWCFGKEEGRSSSGVLAKPLGQPLPLEMLPPPPFSQEGNSS